MKHKIYVQVYPYFAEEEGKVNEIVFAVVT